MTDFIDVYLRAADEAAMTDALLCAGFLQEDASGALYHPDAALLMIGAIDSDSRTGSNTKAAAKGPFARWREVPGYHANVRTTERALAAALDALRIYPATPSYAWAEGGRL